MKFKKKQKVVLPDFKTKIRIIAFTIAIILQSCQYFEKKESKDVLLKKELKRIDWKDVDEYPSFGNCDIFDTKNQQKQCFFEFLNSQIQHKLDSVTKFDSHKKIDTILLKIVITPNSKLIYKLHSTDSLSRSHAFLDSILKTPTMQFYNLKPALKRGIPVQIQFETKIRGNKI